MDNYTLSKGELIASRLIAAGVMDSVPAVVCQELDKYYNFPVSTLRAMSVAGNMFAKVVLDFKEANGVK